MKTEQNGRNKFSKHNSDNFIAIFGSSFQKKLKIYPSGTLLWQLSHEKSAWAEGAHKKLQLLCICNFLHGAISIWRTPVKDKRDLGKKNAFVETENWQQSWFM